MAGATYQDFIDKGFVPMDTGDMPVIDGDKFGLGKPVEWGLPGPANWEGLNVNQVVGAAARVGAAYATGGMSEIAAVGAGGSSEIKVDNKDPGGIQLNVDPTGKIAAGVDDIFLRIVVIVLGFIFVAAGLYMFKPATIAVIKNAA